VQRPNTDLVFAACSGAKTGDVLAKQVSSLTSATRWVTVTIGGNDAGFSSVITECAQPWWSSNCNGAIDGAQSYIRNTLPGKLDQVYSSIKSRSPTATVIVLSYPRLFMGVDCNAGTFFSSDEMTRLNQTADLLRDTTRTRATAAGPTQTASSARRTASESRSASLYATTAGRPRSRQARSTLSAISPRLAINTLRNRVVSPS